MKKAFYLLVGGISLGLGILGLFLPILPTTPFLLLASACFLKGSQKAHDWLHGHRVFGRYLRNYEKGIIDYKDRRNTLIVLYIGIFISILLVRKLIVAIILILIALGVTIHLMSLEGVDGDSS